MATKHSNQRPGVRQSNEEHWRVHVLAQENSGLSQREYCVQHDLGYSTFTRWRRLVLQAQEAGDPSQVSRFVPVVIEPASPPPIGGRSVDQGIRLVLINGVRLEGITATNLSVAAALVVAL